MSRVTRSSSRLRLSESKENLLNTHCDETNEETPTSSALTLREPNVPVDKVPIATKSVKKADISILSNEDSDILGTVSKSRVSGASNAIKSAKKSKRSVDDQRTIVKVSKRASRGIAQSEMHLPIHSLPTIDELLQEGGKDQEPTTSLLPNKNGAKDDNGKGGNCINSELPLPPLLESSRMTTAILPSVEASIVSTKRDKKRENYVKDRMPEVILPPQVDDISTLTSLFSTVDSNVVSKKLNGKRHSKTDKEKDNIRVSQISLPPPALDGISTMASLLSAVEPLVVVGKKSNRKRETDGIVNASKVPVTTPLDDISTVYSFPSCVESNVVGKKINRKRVKVGDDKISEASLPPLLDCISTTNAVSPLDEPNVVGKKRNRNPGKAGKGKDGIRISQISLPLLPDNMPIHPLSIGPSVGKKLTRKRAKGGSSIRTESTDLRCREKQSSATLEDWTVQDGIFESVSIINSDLVVDRKDWIESLFKVEISFVDEGEIRGGSGGDARQRVEGEVREESGHVPRLAVVIRGLDAQRIHCKEYLTALCDPRNVDTLAYPSDLHDILTDPDTVRKVEQESHAHLRFGTHSPTMLLGNNCQISQNAPVVTLFGGASCMEIPGLSNSPCTFRNEQPMKNVSIQGSDCLAVGLAMSALEDIIENHSMGGSAGIRGGNEGFEDLGDVTGLEDTTLDNSALLTPGCAQSCSVKRRRWKKSSAILDTQLNKLSMLYNVDDNEIDGFESMTTNDDDALKRTILSVLRDVTLVEEQEQCHVEGLPDKVRRVALTKVAIDESVSRSQKATVTGNAGDSLVDKQPSSSNVTSLSNVDILVCTPLAHPPPVKNLVPSDCISEYIDWDVLEETVIGSGLDVVDNSVDSSLASHHFDLNASPIAKTMFSSRPILKRSSVRCGKSFKEGKHSRKVDQASSVVTHQKQPSENLSPIQELVFGDGVSAAGTNVKQVVGNLRSPIPAIANNVAAKGDFILCQEEQTVFPKQEQSLAEIRAKQERSSENDDQSTESDLFILVSSANNSIIDSPMPIESRSADIVVNESPADIANKHSPLKKKESLCVVQMPDQIAQNPDHMAQKQDQMAQKSDQIVQKPDQITQKPDQITQKSGQIMQKPDQITQKLDQITQRSDQITQKPDQIPQKPDQVTQKSDHTQQKSDQQEKKLDRIVKKPSDYKTQKPSPVTKDVAHVEKKLEVCATKLSKNNSSIVSKRLPQNKRLDNNQNISIIDLTADLTPAKMVADHSKSGSTSSTQLPVQNPVITGAYQVSTEASDYGCAMSDVINKIGATKVTNPTGKLRCIVLDGSNIAMAHGKNQKFSCRGISLCVQYFLDRGHTEVVAFVPQTRQAYSKDIVDQHILTKLFDSGHLVWTPARKFGNERIVCYDDRYILKLADMKSGIVVSNDNYRDIWEDSPEYRPIISRRLLPVVFVGDIFMPPDDPLGRGGPKLDQFLMCDPTTPAYSSTQNCGATTTTMTSGCLPLMSIGGGTRVPTQLVSQQQQQQKDWCRIQQTYQQTNWAFERRGGGGGGGGAIRHGASTVAAHRPHPYHNNRQGNSNQRAGGNYYYRR